MAGEIPNGSGREFLEIGAKAILPATICCYVSGFVVASPFYAKAGVPLYDIPSHAYLGAGLLFLTYTGASVVAGLAARRAFMAAKWARLRNLVIAVLLPLLLLANLSPSVRALPYFFLVATGAGLLGSSTIASPSRSLLFDHAWRWTRAALLWVCAATLFSQLVYPVTPVEFGGGAAPILFNGSPRVLAGDPAVDYWSKISCPGVSSVTESECLTVRRIQETSEHLYISIQRSAHACPQRPSRRKHWAWGWNQGLCFVRVNAREVPTIVLPGDGW